MKKISILLVIVIFITIGSVYSQGFYVKPFVSYSVGVNGNYMDNGMSNLFDPYSWYSRTIFNNFNQDTLLDFGQK